MAKKQKQVKTPKPYMMWQYEWLWQEPGQPDELLWINEDDERTASYKTLSEGATGRIRSKLSTDDESEWVVKHQDYLP